MHCDKGLPIDKALHPDTMLAWAQNGQMLEHLHGAPVCLLVPGWSGNSMCARRARTPSCPGPPTRGGWGQSQEPRSNNMRKNFSAIGGYQVTVE